MGLKFVKGGIDETADYLAGVIGPKLAAGKTVLWLVPGGSAIKVAARAAGLLKINLKNLVVTLTDERYGQPDHRDSNWPQLKAAGLKLPGAQMHPVLEGKDLKRTAEDFAGFLNESLGEADYAVALGGMGPDGHILGIKPGSPSLNDDEYAVGYKWNDFTRLTATASLLKRLDEVVIFAQGKEKWPQFDKLADKIDPADQPAQLLKRLKKVIIYNDYKGGNL